MILAKCDLGHAFKFPHDREDEPASNCPTCGLLTWNPTRPKRKRPSLGAVNVVGDTDRWNPYCPGLGELDPAKKAARIKDGTIRKNPATGNWEGYAETHQKYREMLREQGCENIHGEGKIDPTRQGWDGKR